jgi:hypothetical protein
VLASQRGGQVDRCRDTIESALRRRDRGGLGEMTVDMLGRALIDDLGFPISEVCFFFFSFF